MTSTSGRPKSSVPRSPSQAMPTKTTTTPVARQAHASRQPEPSRSATTSTNPKAQPSHPVRMGPVVKVARSARPRWSPPGTHTEASVGQLPDPGSAQPHGRWSTNRATAEAITLPTRARAMATIPPAGNDPRNSATAVSVTISGNSGTKAVTTAVRRASPATRAANGRGTSPSAAPNGSRPESLPMESRTHGIAA